MARDLTKDKVEAELRKAGYCVYKKCFPDLVAVRGEEVRFITIRREGSRSDGTTRQRFVAHLLKKKGIKVELCLGSIMNSVRMIE